MATKAASKSSKLKAKPKVIKNIEDIYIISSSKSMRVLVDKDLNKIEEIYEADSSDLYNLFKVNSSSSILPYDCISLEEKDGYNFYYLQKSPTSVLLNFLSKSYNIAIPYTLWRVQVEGNYIENIYMMFSLQDIRSNPNVKLFDSNLPNVYNSFTGGSGEVCIGDLPINKKTVIENVGNIPSVFWGSKFNCDIMPNSYNTPVGKFLTKSFNDDIRDTQDNGDCMNSAQMHKVFESWQKATKENPLFWFDKNVDKGEFSFSYLKNASAH